MHLLIDIGNTNTHVGTATGNEVVADYSFPTRDWAGAAATRKLRGVMRSHGGSIDLLAFCSVVPSAIPRLQAFARSLQVRCVQLKPDRQNVLTIKYRTPKTLGADRLANAIAGYRIYGGPVAVLGLGTAVVVDVVDAQGAYLGGIIGPGMAMFRDYLHESTAQLPSIKLRECRRFIGRDTEEALLAGCVNGFRGMIREWMTGIRAELGTRRLTVVATGPYPEYLQGLIPGLIVARRSLTLEGLRIFATAKVENETEE